MGMPRKSSPEMLLVSFCDILTISISALFMATIITVFESTKVPEMFMVPRAISTDKTPAFFECRSNQVFFVDKDGLDEQVTKLMASANVSKSGDLSELIRLVAEQNVGNKFYKVIPSYLLTGVVAVEPRPEVAGVTIEELKTPNNQFLAFLRKVNPSDQYLVFLVRDDSFDVFRDARKLADRVGYDVGWELLGIDEPIKFGEGVKVRPQ
jgi:hypothetical protein